MVKSLNGKLMLPLVYGASRARRLPFVLWTGMWHHPRTAFHRVTRPLTQRVYRGAEAIVAYGEHVERYLVETADVDARKIFVAGQAVEPERFAAVRPARDGDAEVLFVGQFEERKGIADLLAAFADLGDVDARLRLVGNGSLGPEIDRCAAQNPRLDVVGYLPENASRRHSPALGAYVLPSVTTDLDRRALGRSRRSTRQLHDEAFPSSPPKRWARWLEAWCSTIAMGWSCPSAILRPWPPRSAGSPVTPRWRLALATKRGATSSASITARWRMPSWPRSNTRSPGDVTEAAFSDPAT